MGIFNTLSSNAISYLNDKSSLPSKAELGTRTNTEYETGISQKVKRVREEIHKVEEAIDLHAKQVKEGLKKEKLEEIIDPNDIFPSPPNKDDVVPYYNTESIAGGYNICFGGRRRAVCACEV